MAQIKVSIVINAPVEQVDDLVRDPRKWPMFFIGLDPPEEIIGDGGPGTVVKGSMEFVLGFHARETTTVTEERHEPDGTHWRWDAQGLVPYWLTCHHEPRDGGTLITTEWAYTLPWGRLGRFADRLLFERMQRRDGQRSLENMKRILEGAQARVQRVAP